MPKETHTLAQTLARAKVGAALRARRQALGLSQQVVADAVGVTVPTISTWETGRAQGGLRLDALVSLAEALGCHLRLEVAEGAGDLQIGGLSELPRELQHLPALWATLDDRGRTLILAAIRAAVPDAGRDTQQIGNIAVRK